MLEKQRCMLEFCGDLIDVAIRVNEKSRNIDTLRACESKLRGELSENDLSEIQKKIEHVLSHINLFVADAKQKESSEDVAKQEVHNKMRQILAECVENGEQMKNSYAASGIAQVHRVKEVIGDYVHVEANYETMCNSERMLEQCSQLAQNYDMEIQSLGAELVADVTSLYNESMKHIEKMIMSIGRGVVACRMKELYEKWDGRVAQAENNVRQKVVTLESGRLRVVQFAEKCQEPLQKIIRKNKKKCKFMKLCPLLIIVFLIIGFIAYGQIINYQNMDSEKIEETDDNFIGQVEEKVQEAVADEVADKVTSLVGEAVVPILIPFLLLLGFAYVGWNVHANKISRGHTVQEIGRFMSSQVNEFVTSNDMENIQSQYFEEIVRQLNATYGEMIMVIFGDIVALPSEKASEVEFDMESKWEEIKNMKEI